MAGVPRGVSGAQACAAFRRDGWEVRRTGNHIILAKPGNPTVLSVPNHRELAIGTLGRLIRDAGLTNDQFIDLL